jgi:hypothetical protein
MRSLARLAAVALGVIAAISELATLTLAFLAVAVSRRAPAYARRC